MILSILFKQKYPILFVALNFADIALLVSLSQTGYYNKAEGSWRKSRRIMEKTGMSGP
jgi:hypothetical protein